MNVCDVAMHHQIVIEQTALRREKMEVALIEKEALRLTVAERALLADHLLQTLGREDSSVMKAWTDEAERRLGLFANGSIEAFDGKSVVDALRKGLR